MLVRDINDNKLIPRPSYLGVYEDKSKNESSADKTMVHVSPSILGIRKLPNIYFKRVLVVVG